ncbi:UNVERIFIED_CONTAM: hypothetical protein Sradi_4862200 [Sesamum radiatum]|uniref:Transposase MuDR plant domain-containing protein n=1 Tax=Sesamum radiatum TaxID=300843 RepID=A0AAW2N0U0_SESRA
MGRLYCTLDAIQDTPEFDFGSNEPTAENEKEIKIFEANDWETIFKILDIVAEGTKGDAVRGGEGEGGETTRGGEGDVANAVRYGKGNREVEEKRMLMMMLKIEGAAGDASFNSEFTLDEDIIGSGDDVESEYENEEDDGKAVFNASGKYDPNFEIGMIFSSKSDFKDVVYGHAVKTRRSLKITKNDSRRIYARCDGEWCEWRINVLKVIGSDKRYYVRHLHGNMKTTCFKGLAYKSALWNVVRATTESEFKVRMEEMIKLNEKVVDWKWDLTGIPCNHAMSTICSQVLDPEDFVNPCYSVQTFKRVYRYAIMPVNGPKLWAQTGNIPPFPSNFGRKTSRLSRARRMEPDEIPNNQRRNSKTGQKKPIKLKRQSFKVKCHYCGGKEKDHFNSCIAKSRVYIFFASLDLNKEVSYCCSTILPIIFVVLSSFDRLENPCPLVRGSLLWSANFPSVLAAVGVCLAVFLLWLKPIRALNIGGFLPVILSFLSGQLQHFPASRWKKLKRRPLLQAAPARLPASSPLPLPPSMWLQNRPMPHFLPPPWPKETKQGCLLKRPAAPPLVLHCDQSNCPSPLLLCRPRPFPVKAPTIVPSHPSSQGKPPSTAILGLETVKTNNLLQRNTITDFQAFISDMEASPSHAVKDAGHAGSTSNTPGRRSEAPLPGNESKFDAIVTKQTSFAGLFSNNRKLTNDNKLMKFEVGGEMMKLETNDLINVRAKLGHCLIGYIAGKFPGLKAIQALSQSWGASFQLHDSGWLIFRFAKDEDRQRILAGGPYFVYGRPLLLKNMPGCFEFKEDDISLASVWATLPSLPLECWHPNALWEIGSRLGTSIAMDSLTMKWSEYHMPILVEVDASKKLVDHVEFILPNGVVRKQSIVYEFKPKFLLDMQPLWAFKRIMPTAGRPYRHCHCHYCP